MKYLLACTLALSAAPAFAGPIISSGTDILIAACFTKNTSSMDKGFSIEVYDLHDNMSLTIRDLNEPTSDQPDGKIVATMNAEFRPQPHNGIFNRIIGSAQGSGRYFDLEIYKEKTQIGFTVAHLVRAQLDSGEMIRNQDMLCSTVPF
jgi:hypothetical protein